MRSFETLTYEEVEDAAGIMPVVSMPCYEDWLNAPSELEYHANERQKENLEELRELLFDEAKNWNESDRRSG